MRLSPFVLRARRATFAVLLGLACTPTVSDPNPSVPRVDAADPPAGGRDAAGDVGRTGDGPTTRTPDAAGPGVDRSAGPGPDGGAVPPVVADAQPPPPPSDAGALPGLTGPVSAQGTPFDSDRRDQTGPSGNNSYYSKTPEIVPFANSDGSLDVAWRDQRANFIIISRVVGAEARGHIKVDSLGQLAGFSRDEAGNFYVLTAVTEELLRQATPARTKRDGILRLLKLDPGGRLVYQTDLKGFGNAPAIYSPMGYGTGRLVHAAGKLMMTFSQYTEIDTSINSRHQFHVYARVDATSGQEDGHWRGPGHCFDMRLYHDGTSFIGLMLGDAALRGVGVRRVETARATEKVVFAIKGGDPSTFYQNTYTRLGGLVPVSGGYGVLFATENNATDTAAVVNGSRNLVYLRVKANFDQIAGKDYDVQVVDESLGSTMDVAIRDYWGGSYPGRNKGLVWLTSYTDKATEHAEKPRLVALGGDQLAVIWEKWTDRQYTSTFAMVIDGAGKVAVPPKDIGRARLNRGDDVLGVRGTAVWVTGDETRRALTVNALDRDLSLTRTVVP
jgi:hypothetical protein